MTIRRTERLALNEPGQVPTWTVGDRLRKALDHSGLGVQEMADALGVSRATVGRWLHDKIPPKRPILLVWAITTGVDQQWLETGTAGRDATTGGDLYAIRDSNPEPAD